MEDTVSQTYEHELIKSVDLKKWEWSKNGEKEYNPPIIPREDLHKMLKKRLTEGKSIRVRIGEEWLGLKHEYMDPDKMAEKIEEKIHDRNDIRKDPKSAEALAFKIRSSLDAIMNTPFRGTVVFMEQQEFVAFLKGEDLKAIFDEDIDPIQQIINGPD